MTCVLAGKLDTTLSGLPAVADVWPGFSIDPNGAVVASGARQLVCGRATAEIGQFPSLKYGVQRER